MRIKFGFYLDGTEWSAAPASLGEMTCGPLGLLAWLEEHLGLTSVDVPQSERIGLYKEKIAAADCAWCRESFRLDAWSCAKQLLAWRGLNTRQFIELSKKNVVYAKFVMAGFFLLLAGLMSVLPLN